MNIIKSRFGQATALSVVVGLSLTACAAGSQAGAENEQEEYVIGAALALSGPFSSYDEPPLQALELYVEQVNEAGGIDGKTIELVTADIQSDPAQGPIAAQQLLDQGADLIVASCDFDMGSPAATVAVENDVLAVSTCAGTALFGPQALGQNAFTAGTPVETEAAAMAEWAFNEGEFRNAGIIVDESIAFNPIYVNAFKEVWEDLGGTIVAEHSFQAGDASVADQVARLGAEDDIDVIVAATLLPDGPNVVQQMRSGGVEQPILGHSGMSGTDWVPTVAGLGEFYFTDMVALQGVDPRPEVVEVTEAYAAEYGEAPAGIAFTGYILGEMITHALEGNGGDPAGTSMANWLEENTITTILGETTFSSEDHIDRERPQVVLSHDSDGGTPEVQELVTPTSVPRVE